MSPAFDIGNDGTTVSTLYHLKYDLYLLWRRHLQTPTVSCSSPFDISVADTFVFAHVHDSSSEGFCLAATLSVVDKLEFASFPRSLCACNRGRNWSMLCEVCHGLTHLHSPLQPPQYPRSWQTDVGNGKPKLEKPLSMQMGELKISMGSDKLMLPSSPTTPVIKSRGLR